MTVNTFILLPKNYISNKCSSFEGSSLRVSTQKILSSTIVFNTDNIYFKLLEHQFSTLKLFLKDHGTPKTGITAAENSALNHKNKLQFKIFSN